MADFIDEHCRIPEDAFAGRKGTPFITRPWQREALRHIFARKADGSRRHRLAIYSTARKNGKTGLAAGVALHELVDGQEGGQIISAATDREQARLVWKAARQMVELDPDLSEEVHVYAHVLEHKGSGSVYRAISAEAFTKEGLSPTVAIVDELHAFPTRELFDVLSLAQGARRDPLMLVVSTAGVMSTRTEDESILFQLHNYGQSLIRGEAEDPTFFMAWWAGDDEADHRAEANWHPANPALADAVPILDIDDLRSKVRVTPESEFRTKRLNLFVPTEAFWLPAEAWEACKAGDALDPKLPVAVGIDIGIVHDASAVVIAQKQGERVVVRGRYWMNPHPRGTVAHEEWRMPLDELIQYLRDLRRLYPAPAARIDDIPVPGPAYVYDRYGLASAELTLEAERGFALIPVPQAGGWMVEASRRFYEAVLDRRIAHDGDPTLAAHLRNVVPRQVGESGWRLEKPSKSKKIDAAVAAVMAVSQALEEAPRKRFRAFAA